MNKIKQWPLISKDNVKVCRRFQSSGQLLNVLPCGLRAMVLTTTCVLVKGHNVWHRKESSTPNKASGCSVGGRCGHCECSHIQETEAYYALCYTWRAAGYSPDTVQERLSAGESFTWSPLEGDALGHLKECPRIWMSNCHHSGRVQS